MKSETSPIFVTIHHSDKRSRSKLDGMQSINTSPRVNPFCIARQRVPDAVCSKCFAMNFIAYRKNMNAQCEENFKTLNERLLTWEEATAVPLTTLYVRIESMGDVGSVIHARNYVRIIKTHPLSKFGIWSKNHHYWQQAFQIEGKPLNCTYVYSSEKIGLPEYPVSTPIGKYVDHVFTVFDPKSADYDEFIINCGGKRCMDCLACYKKDTGYYINERLK